MRCTWCASYSLPETRSLLAAQMAWMSSSFSVFIVFGIYTCMHEATCTTLWRTKMLLLLLQLHTWQVVMHLGSSACAVHVVYMFVGRTLNKALVLLLLLIHGWKASSIQFSILRLQVLSYFLCACSTSKLITLVDARYW